MHHRQSAALGLAGLRLIRGRRITGCHEILRTGTQFVYANSNLIFKETGCETFGCAPRFGKNMADEMVCHQESTVTNPRLYVVGSSMFNLRCANESGEINWSRIYDYTEALRETWRGREETLAFAWLWGSILIFPYPLSRNSYAEFLLWN